MGQGQCGTRMEGRSAQGGAGLRGVEPDGHLPLETEAVEAQLREPKAERLEPQLRAPSHHAAIKQSSNQAKSRRAIDW